MTVKAFDVAWGAGNIRPADAKAMGFDVWLGYASEDPSKDLTADEIAEAHAAGMGVGIVWETTADQAAGGAPVGQNHGRGFAAKLAALNWPATVGAFVANDEDMDPSQWPASAAYLDAIRARIQRPEGGYGKTAWLEQMYRDGHITLLWGTVAWSHGQQPAEAHLWQDGTQTDIDGVTVDVDWAPDRYAGIWWPTPSPTPEEDDMIWGSDTSDINMRIVDGRCAKIREWWFEHRGGEPSPQQQSAAYNLWAQRGGDLVLAGIIDGTLQ